MPFGRYHSDDDYLGNGNNLQLSESAMESLNEQLLVEECTHFSDEQLKMFLESDICKQLVQEGKMRKNTIVILSKDADYERRLKLICFNLAKADNDSDWNKLKKNRVIERQLIGRIVKKYRHRADKLAKVEQKDWIKNRMPANFGKFGGADR